MKLLWIILGIVLMTTAEAASFDCAKAQTDIEKTICSDTNLSSQDTDLGKAYKRALIQNKNPKQTSVEQRKWLEHVRNMCHDKNCLSAAYAARINALTTPGAEQQHPKKIAKQSARKAKNPQMFVSFFKERSALDDSYEIASPEAERLIGFIKSQEKLRNSPVIESFSDSLKQEEGEYLKITDAVFIVNSGFVTLLVDMNSPKFTGLIFGYGGVSVVENGLSADGTGWILTKHGSRDTEWGVSNFDLITYFESEQKVDVVTTPLVSERVSFEENNGHWCGTGDEEVKDGIVGRVQGHEWKDIDIDYQDELILHLIETNCAKPESLPVEYQRTFKITKGRVNELH